MRKNLIKVSLYIIILIIITNIILLYCNVQLIPKLSLVVELVFNTMLIILFFAFITKFKSSVLKVLIGLFSSFFIIIFIFIKMLFVNYSNEEVTVSNQKYIVLIDNDISTGLHNPTNTYKYYKKLNYFFMESDEKYTHINMGRYYDHIANMTEERDKER